MQTVHSLYVSIVFFNEHVLFFILFLFFKEADKDRNLSTKRSGQLAEEATPQQVTSLAQVLHCLPLYFFIYIYINQAFLEPTNEMLRKPALVIFVI